MTVDTDQAIDDLVLPLPVHEQPIEEAYAIESVIGEGSYSTVHAATRRCNGESVVVKAVRVDTLDEDERQRALQEAQTLSYLRHTNIIRYHDVRYNEKESALYIIMEHATGGDLAALIKQRACQRRPFNEDFILLVFVQVMLAVSHVHARGYLHRDVKASNVFLMGHDNIVKLGDFGLAKPTQAPHNLAETTVGTPCYCSPEMCENKPYSAKSDIWSLGCLLYELTTLKHAFHGSTLPALIVNILQGRFPPVPSRFSIHLRSLICSMLAQNPARRPTADSILKLPWMQPHLQRYSELMRRQLPENRQTCSSNGSSVACTDAMTLAMPPTVQPITGTATGLTAAVVQVSQFQQPVPDTRTKAACKEVRRLLGNVSASLSARIKETPAAAGASLRSGVIKGKAAVAGARMRLSASHQIRSFCLSDVVDVQISPVLKPEWSTELTRTGAPPRATEVLEAGVTASGAALPGGSAPPAALTSCAEQPDIESLSSLSSVCSQPMRSEDDTAPWGSIVPVHGITLSSPQPKPMDLANSLVAIPAEYQRPLMQPLPRYSKSPDLHPSAARQKPPSLIVADPSQRTCSADLGSARTGQRSARDVARDSHKDDRQANGQRLVSPAWLKDNLSVLEQMQGALTTSMECRRAGSDGMCSRSFASSRASPTPTHCTDVSAKTPASSRAEAASLVVSPRTTPPQYGPPVEQSVPSSPKCKASSAGARRHDTAQTDSHTGPKPRQPRVGKLQSMYTARCSNKLGDAARPAPGVVPTRSVPLLSPDSSALSLREVRSDTLSPKSVKRPHPQKSRTDVQRPRLQHSSSTLSVHAASSKTCARTEASTVKAKAVAQTRPRWSTTHKAAVQTRECVKKADPPKALERLEARRRAAEHQAAHRLALKHVKARVSRQDIQAQARLKPGLSSSEQRHTCRADAPVFVISARPQAKSTDASAAAKSQVGSPKFQGGARQSGPPAKHGAPVQDAAAPEQKPHSRVERLPPGRERCGAVPGTGQAGTAGKMTSSRHVAPLAAMFRAEPSVEIFVPSCSPQKGAGEGLQGTEPPSQKVQASAAQNTISESAATSQSGHASEIHAGVSHASCVSLLNPGTCLQSADVHHDVHVAADQARPIMRAQFLTKVSDDAATAVANAPPECIIHTKKDDVCLQAVKLDVGRTRGCQGRAGEGRGKANLGHVGCSGLGLRSLKARGAGSAPGRVSSPTRTEAGKATAAKVEELRMRLEAQLGEDKLLAAYRYLDSSAGMTPAGVVPPQLEALLAPQTHFAYAVYRLRMMEDMVFA